MSKAIKVFVSVFTIVSVFFSMSVMGYAWSNESDMVAPVYEYADDIISSLSINSGTAELSCSASGSSKVVTKISATMYLEKYNNGKWSATGNWSKSKDGNILTFSKTASVTKGLYRVRTVFTVYSGNKSETISLIPDTTTEIYNNDYEWTNSLQGTQYTTSGIGHVKKYRSFKYYSSSLSGKHTLHVEGTFGASSKALTRYERVE